MQKQTFVALVYISMMLSGFIGPLILLLLPTPQKIKQHCKQALSVQLSLFLYFASLLFTSILVGLFSSIVIQNETASLAFWNILHLCLYGTFFIILIVSTVLSLFGAIQSYRGVEFQYLFHFKTL